MKLSAMTLLGITSLFLLTIVLFTIMSFPFNWIFYGTCAGQVLLVCTVYKVLTDDYQTEKTFKDLYEDRPDLGA
jgi:hypothetical protein